MEEHNMSENARETQTVQKYRHAARRVLTQARENLAIRTEKTHEVYRLLNGTIEEVIRGRQGLSQEEQVEHLSEALGKVQENKGSVEEAVAAAKAEVQAILDNWDTTFAGALDEAASILEEARDFARDRDFDAHQAEKKRSKYGVYGGSTVSEDVADDEDDDLEDDEDED